MDDGNGNFQKVPDTVIIKELSLNIKNRIFEVGEEIAIKDSRFKIMAIGKREMRLRLLSDKTGKEVMD